MSSRGEEMEPGGDRKQMGEKGFTPLVTLRSHIAKGSQGWNSSRGREELAQPPFF